MKMQGRTGTAASRYRKLAALMSGCLVVVFLLSGCGGSVWAAPEIQATPAVAAQAGWVNAGDVTVTPTATAAGDPTPVLTPAEATPAAEATVAPAGEAVQFAGVVENLPATGDWSGNWQVAGRLLHVAATTSIDQRQGQVAPGARVAIEGWSRPDSSVDAGWITVVGPNGTTATVTPEPSATATPAAAGKAGASAGEESQPQARSSEAADEAAAGHPITFRATVQQLPAQGLVGTWLVDGRTVHVNSGTRLQAQFGPFAAGTYVQVHGWLQPDGSINAAWVQVKKATPVGADGGNNPGNGNGNNGKAKGNNSRGNSGKGNGGNGGKGD